MTHPAIKAAARAVATGNGDNYVDVPKNKAEGNRGMTTWAVVRMRVGQEIPCAGRLQARGCVVEVLTYLRQSRRRRGHLRTPETVEVAALPGYGFVSLASLPDLPSANPVAGFYGLLFRADNTVATISDSELDATREILRESEFDRRTGACPFKVGDSVKMKSPDTAWSGIRGKVAGIEPGRVAVKFGSLTVSVPWSKLRASAQ